MDLKVIYQRIKDNVDVLTHFTKKREEGKERSEYLSLLRSDLCIYYSYNQFLISKLMDIFPLSEVCICSFCVGVCGIVDELESPVLAPPSASTRCAAILTG